jgi:hypothetical protein
MNNIVRPVGEGGARCAASIPAGESGTNANPPLKLLKSLSSEQIDKNLANLRAFIGFAADTGCLRKRSL